MLGQALLTKRMGKTAGHRRDRRRPARRRHARPRAALFGLECVVYMGEEDTRRQALNVARMRLLGAEVVPVTTRLAHPQGRDQRGDARLGHQRRDDPLLLGSVVGPHPFPMMVRDFQRVIGDEARAAVLDAGRPAARRGRRLRRRRLQRDRHLPPVRPDDADVRAGRLRGRRRRRRDRPARRAITGGSPGVLHGARSLPAAGRGRPDHRVALASPPAWTTRASARSTPACTTSAGPSTAPVTDAEAMEAFELLCRTEGIIPAIESGARAAPAPLELGRRSCGPDAPIVLVNLSGRGDKDVDTAARWFGLGDREEIDPGPAWTDQQPTEGAVSNDEAVRRTRGQRERAGRRPSAMGTREQLAERSARRRPRAGPRWSATCRPASRPSTAAIAAMLAMVEAGVDVVEVGVPYSDPVMDGPVIQQAVDVAVRRRRPACATCCAPSRRSPPPAPRRGDDATGTRSSATASTRSPATSPPPGERA